MKKSRSVLFGWGISYLLVLAVPILSIFISYSYTTYKLKSETIKANQLIIHNLANSVNTCMKDELAAFHYIYALQKDSDFMDSGNTADFFYGAGKMHQSLKNYKSYNNDIELWACILDQDYIVSPATANYSKYVYNSIKYAHHAQCDYPTWHSQLQDSYQDKFFLSRNLNSAAKGMCLTYANTIAGNSGSWNLFVSVPVSTLEKLSSKLSTGTVFCLLKDGKPLLSFNKNGLITDAASSQKDDGKYITLHQKASVSHYTYSLRVPGSTFWNSVHLIRNLHVVGLLLIMLIEFFFITFLVRKNYKPLRVMLQSIGIGSTKENEYETVRHAYTKLLRSNQAMEKKMDQTKEIIDSNCLLNLLKGRTPVIADWNMDPFVAEDSGNYRYCLICVSVSYERTSVEHYDELSFFIINNVIGELMAGDTFYKAEDGNFLYYLFRVPEKGKDTWLKNSCAKLKTLPDIFASGNANVRIFIGSFIESYKQLHASYREIMDLLIYRDAPDYGEIILASEFSDPVNILSDSVDSFNLQLEQSLISCADSAQVTGLVGRFFAQNKNTPFAILRLYLMKSYNNVIDLYTKHCESTVQQCEVLIYFERINNAGDNPELEQAFGDLVRFVYNRLDGRTRQQSATLTERIKTYIKNNYADIGLNISSIADALDRSPKYISRLFKSETAIGILDYINNIRIAQSEILIKEDELSLEEIAARTGFSNVRTFYRVFSKITGSTPGRHRGASNG